ncbi:MAG: hypothetical protein JWP97_731, partial [Labilithrix sp.]|nr:hypothetical protein [Labilithrix sp.]
MRKPSLGVETFMAALAVLGATTAGCSRSDRATASPEPAAAAPTAAASDPAPPAQAPAAEAPAAPAEAPAGRAAPVDDKRATEGAAR